VAHVGGERRPLRIGRSRREPFKDLPFKGWHCDSAGINPSSGQRYRSSGAGDQQWVARIEHDLDLSLMRRIADRQGVFKEPVDKRIVHGVAMV
jgi:hypothetical protein